MPSPKKKRKCEPEPINWDELIPRIDYPPEQKKKRKKSGYDWLFGD